MKQHEAVIEVMKRHGGYASTPQLYKEVPPLLNQPKTKTLFNSIRRASYDPKYFFQIEHGLWGLKEAKDELARRGIKAGTKIIREEDEYGHAYYQGLLVEIGNLEGLLTMVPNQDKNKTF